MRLLTGLTTSGILAFCSQLACAQIYGPQLPGVGVQPPVRTGSTEALGGPYKPLTQVTSDFGVANIAAWVLQDFYEVLKKRNSCSVARGICN